MAVDGLLRHPSGRVPGRPARGGRGHVRRPHLPEGRQRAAHARAVPRARRLPRGDPRLPRPPTPTATPRPPTCGTPSSARAGGPSAASWTPGSTRAATPWCGSGRTAGWPRRPSPTGAGGRGHRLPLAGAGPPAAPLTVDRTGGPTARAAPAPSSRRRDAGAPTADGRTGAGGPVLVNAGRVGLLPGRLPYGHPRAAWPASSASWPRSSATTWSRTPGPRRWPGTPR